MRPGQSSCGLLALPQEDLPAQGSSTRVVYRHASAGLLGDTIAMFLMAARGFALCVRAHHDVCLFCCAYETPNSHTCLMAVALLNALSLRIKISVIQCAARIKNHR